MVTVDGKNHPLAGMQVRFEAEVLMHVQRLLKKSRMATCMVQVAIITSDRALPSLISLTCYPMRFALDLL